MGHVMEFLSYLVEDVAQPYIADGSLIRLREDWCAPYTGYRLYYLSRRESSPAFNVLVDVLRHPSAGAGPRTTSREAGIP